MNCTRTASSVLLFRGAGRSLTPREVLTALGAGCQSPALPEACLRWREALEPDRAGTEIRISA
jgi:hypothetical protein